MTIRNLEVKGKAGRFIPEVTVNGMTLTVAAAPFTHMGRSGTVPEASVTFQPGDVGKYLYAILTKVGDTYVYDLAVQDPSVLKPIGTGPVEGEELYAFLSGRILDGDIDLEVRYFLEEAP